MEALAVVAAAATTKWPDAALPKAAGLELEVPTVAVAYLAADCVPVMVSFPVTVWLPVWVVLPDPSIENWSLEPTFIPFK